MKKSIFVIGTIITLATASLLFTSCGSHNHEGDDATEHEAVATTYACPMHPEITGKESDKCSKCGMALVATADEKTDTDKSAVASCPMHSEITGKEGDKCSKCGMPLVLAEAGKDDQHEH